VSGVSRRADSPGGRRCPPGDRPRAARAARPRRPWPRGHHTTHPRNPPSDCHGLAQPQRSGVGRRKRVAGT
jgi:hypothetical protein